MRYYRPSQELTGKRLSASTLASFMAAQSVDDPDQIRPGVNMSSSLLHFLLRDRAISYWSTNRWLKADLFNQYFTLTNDGIQKVQDRLAGRAKAQSVTREAVLAEFQIIRGLSRSEPLVPFDLPTQGEVAANLNLGAESDRTPVEPEPQLPDDGDRLNTEERVLTAIWSRRGQPEFRAQLLDAYGSRCAITCCDVVDALEAAHITPFAEEQAYALSNGVLLRGDIHTLFDLFLLSIDPSSWTVHIAPQLAGAYGTLDGIKISLPADTSAQPNQRRLLRHYTEWRKRWCSPAR